MAPLPLIKCAQLKGRPECAATLADPSLDANSHSSGVEGVEGSASSPDKGPVLIVFPFRSCRSARTDSR